MTRRIALLTTLSLPFAGALFPLGLAPFNWWPIGMLSVALLVGALRGTTTAQAYRRAFGYGAGLFLCGSSWVYVSIHEYGYVNAPLAASGTILFCLFVAAVFALPFTLCALFPKRSAIWLIGFPSAWVVSEWLRSWLLTGFPWLYAGYMHTDTWLAGWAPIGGVYLLSFIHAFIATWLARIATGSGRTPAIRVGALVLIGVFAAGYLLRDVEWTTPSTSALSVALIQPDIAQEKKWDPQHRIQIIEQLFAQTEGHWNNNVIVWPEGAIPATQRQAANYIERAARLAAEHQATLLTGLPYFDYERGTFHNAMLAVGADQGMYFKTRLVPFGEYVPLESLLRGLMTFFDLPMSSFSLPPDNQRPLVVKGETLATAICYEVVYPDLVARSAKDASIILTVSNDAWFGHSIGPLQHMQMARMRAIEQAKPMIRGTNNGVTALVDQRGQITQQLPRFSKGEMVGVVVPRRGATPFAVAGSWPIILLSLFCCAILGLRHKF